MSDTALANELARRAGVSPADAAAVLQALGEVARERALAAAATKPCSEPPYVPSAREVEDLIAAACRHPLGLQFLIEGQLGAVAIAFGAHAFAVDAARRRLKEEGAPAALRQP